MVRLRFKKMGKPVGNIDSIIDNTMNYSTTATLSVIDGVGIFGGRYRWEKGATNFFFTVQK